MKSENNEIDLWILSILFKKCESIYDIVLADHVSQVTQTILRLAVFLCVKYGPDSFCTFSTYSISSWFN